MKSLRLNMRHDVWRKLKYNGKYHFFYCLLFIFVHNFNLDFFSDYAKHANIVYTYDA